LTAKARPLLIVEDDPALQKQICWAFDQYETLPQSTGRARLPRCGGTRHPS
jgi:two-component system NtrC family response regulator